MLYVVGYVGGMALAFIALCISSTERRGSPIEKVGKMKKEKSNFPIFKYLYLISNLKHENIFSFRFDFIHRNTPALTFTVLPRKHERNKKVGIISTAENFQTRFPIFYLTKGY